MRHWGDRWEPVKKPRDYTGILVEELELHGHPVTYCPAAYKWYLYRRNILSLLKRWRKLGLPQDYKRELEREAKMTMVILAGYYHTCRNYYWRKATEEKKLWAARLYAELVDSAKRLNAYLEPCTRYNNTTECWRARIQLALEGARNPALVEYLIRKY